MSPRARNGANNRGELGVSKIREREAVLVLVDEERALFEGGATASSFSGWTAIVVYRVDFRFLFSYIILHPLPSFQRLGHGTKAIGDLPACSYFCSGCVLYWRHRLITS